MNITLVLSIIAVMVSVAVSAFALGYSKAALEGVKELRKLEKQLKEKETVEKPGDSGYNPSYGDPSVKLYFDQLYAGSDDK